MNIVIIECLFRRDPPARQLEGEERNWKGGDSTDAWIPFTRYTHRYIAVYFIPLEKEASREQVCRRSGTRTIHHAPLIMLDVFILTSAPS